MTALAIKIEKVSKAYQLGDFGTGTISRDIERYWARLRGKEDPFIKIGEENDRTRNGTGNVVWSLKDISLDIERGEIMGIIGRNGAGKSTLLKILSRITAPTVGSIKIKGRIASLLEVGTGFHPELTGRENIFLNGAILGMRKTEIKRKFDEIVDFSGVERYIDTPVKRYSSGMYVRLAFSVAAHLESEILIVDEVLAVGDAEFQKKCLGKMGEVSRGDGRTVLFVSHNMASIQNLCSKAILLKNGALELTGNVQRVIEHYLNAALTSKAFYDLPFAPNTPELPGYAYRLQVEDLTNESMTEIRAGSPWQLRVFFRLNQAVQDFALAVGMTTPMGINLRTVWSKKKNLEAGDYEAVFIENTILLAAGTYNLIIGLSQREKTFWYLDDAGCLNINHLSDPSLDEAILRVSDCGAILNTADIIISRLG